MEKHPVNHVPELTEQVKSEITSGIRVYMVAKSFFFLLAVIATPVIAIFLADSRSTKTYFVLGGVSLFFALILFYIFCPKLISKKFQLNEYIKDLHEETKAWQKIIKTLGDNQDKLEKQDALLISPYPEITRRLQNTFSESVKLMQNINGNYELSLRMVVEQYNHLCILYTITGQNSDLYEPLKEVTETLQKSHEERLLAATKFFETCKIEQKDLPSRASAFKMRLIGLQQAEIFKCENEIIRIKDKKNEAKFMLNFF